MNTNIPNPDNDDKTVFVSRTKPDQNKVHICPMCGTSNTSDQLIDREYRCSSCKLELAHLDYGPNDSIRGIFGWLLPVGVIFNDRYMIKQVLGKGGFGATYLVDDLRLAGKRRALKEVPELLFDQYESSLLSRLDHPSIPDIIDHVVANGMQYLVLKFGGSRTLGNERKISPNQRIPLDKLIPWMIQLCEVLIYLHSQNPPVIHRDLKPDNILLNEDDRIMLIDFGIAKEISTEHTRTSANAVSESFSSPEQVAGTGTDVRADIYSLGATFYALLTGLNPPGAFARLSGQELIPPSKIVTDVAPEVESSIMQALNLKKEERQQSVREFAIALGTGDIGRTRLNPTSQSVGSASLSSRETFSINREPTLQINDKIESTDSNVRNGTRRTNPFKQIFLYGIVLSSIVGVVVYYFNSSETIRTKDISPSFTQPIPNNESIPTATNPTQSVSPSQVEIKSESAPIPSPPLKSAEQLLVELLTQIKSGDADPKVYSSDLENLLDQFIPPIKGFPLSLSQNGIYREKDLIKFKLTLPATGYLHVFIFEPNGKATLIYPSQYAKKNRVEPGLLNLPNGKPPIIAGPPYGKSWLLAFFVGEGESNNLYQTYSNDKNRMKDGLIELRIWEVLGLLQERLGDPETKAAGAQIITCPKLGPCP